mgnify:CR=1 FL=1
MIKFPDSMLKKRIFSYADTKKEQIIIIIPSEGQVVSDSQGHSQQNVQFKGVVDVGHIQGFTYLNEKSYIVFPKITFQTMIFNYFKTRQEVEDFMKRDFECEIVFTKHNKKKYVATSIKAKDEIKQAQCEDII